MYIGNLVFALWSAWLLGLAFAAPSSTPADDPFQTKSQSLDNQSSDFESESEHGNKTEPDLGPEYKYFNEPGMQEYLGHYDARFFKGVVSDAERSESLTHMMRAYLNFFNEAGLDTWVAHGTLLGWWWNGKILPWDWDIDTQVPVTTLTYMATHFNQSTVDYTSFDRTVKRKYLLDVNPWALQSDRGIGLNVIDARWIDTHNGLYIDITGLRKLYPDTDPDVWECKNFHKYKTKELYPLRTTVFEGVPAKVPFKYSSILIDEYSIRALTATKFNNHTYDPQLHEWVMDKDLESQQ